jgi:hypothetical protein
MPRYVHIGGSIPSWLLYWSIGKTIRDRQAEQGWGSKVIDRLGTDLRLEFPEMTGLSPSNLFYMRQLAEAWPNEIVQQAVGQLPWGHVTILLRQPDRPGLVRRRSSPTRLVLHHSFLPCSDRPTLVRRVADASGRVDRKYAAE